MTNEEKEKKALLDETLEKYFALKHKFDKLHGSKETKEERNDVEIEYCYMLINVLEVEANILASKVSTLEIIKHKISYYRSMTKRLDRYLKEQQHDSSRKKG